MSVDIAVLFAQVRCYHFLRLLVFGIFFCFTFCVHQFNTACHYSLLHVIKIYLVFALPMCNFIYFDMIN